MKIFQTDSFCINFQVEYLIDYFFLVCTPTFIAQVDIVALLYDNYPIERVPETVKEFSLDKETNIDGMFEEPSEIIDYPNNS